MPADGRAGLLLAVMYLRDPVQGMAQLYGSGEDVGNAAEERSGIAHSFIVPDISGRVCPVLKKDEPEPAAL